MLTGKDNKKRYYKQGETVWVKSEGCIGEIVELDVKPVENVYEALVKILEGEQEGSLLKINLWEIDKNKRKEKVQPSLRVVQDDVTTILFAKVRETAIVPSKEDENGGYDVYADISTPVVNPKGITISDPLTIKPNEIALIPTGVASSLLDKYRFVLKERGSTGSIGMEVRSGVIDSGYRGEWFVAMKNGSNKSIVITSHVKSIVESEDTIYYPTSKAIAQGNLQIVPKANVKEITYGDLKKIPSKRGNKLLGQSGK